jgi:hypothetical protein
MENTIYRQIGRNCLQDFLGVDVSSLVAQAELLLSVSDILSSAEDIEFGQGGCEARFVTTNTYLPFVCCSIRENGWLSRGAAYERGDKGASTCDLAFSFGVYAKEHDKDRYKPTEKDYNLASAVIEFCEEYFANCDVDALSDYENSLRVAMASGIAHPKFAGLIASSVQFYNRDLEKRTRNESWAKMVASSTFQGVVGERQVFEGLQVVSYRTWQNDYGTTHFYSFNDANGNAYTYFASKDMDLSVGQIISLRATVKKHENYTPKFAGAVTYAQTILTRCALVARATVVSSEVVEVQEEKYVAADKQAMDAYKALPYLEQMKVPCPQPTYVSVINKYSHYHLVGAEGRKFVLISKSKKKGLTVGVTALVEYAVEDLSKWNNGSRPVSFVAIV